MLLRGVLVGGKRAGLVLHQDSIIHQLAYLLRHLMQLSDIGCISEQLNLRPPQLRLDRDRPLLLLWWLLGRLGLAGLIELLV